MSHHHSSCADFTRARREKPAGGLRTTGPAGTLSRAEARALTEAGYLPLPDYLSFPVPTAEFLGSSAATRLAVAGQSLSLVDANRANGRVG